VQARQLLEPEQRALQEQRPERVQRERPELALREAGLQELLEREPGRERLVLQEAGRLQEQVRRGPEPAQEKQPGSAVPPPQELVMRQEEPS
jgi:hypothetical protein